MHVKSDRTQLKHISFPQQAVTELAKCKNHTKSHLFTSRGVSHHSCGKESTSSGRSSQLQAVPYKEEVP